ncbi:serine/threonine protein kinase [Archangium lipolyticum]|uniref:serine/threonine protein kinase n=1 Tax=Archangium lipolyticum TaxID=2970465 RepID=UPI00214A37BA|nr:serine/threonine-protein kinase [Archangium lipolyticum]
MGFFSKLPDMGEKVGDYRIVGRLGRGGGGTVFKAERAGRLVVLKFLHASALGGRARREISILLRLDSPRVVRFIGCDQWPEPQEGTPYIVMEFVEGPTLEVYARANNPPARRAAHLMLEAALALGEVHQQDVLHRDLKPENILIRSEGEQPVLIDFGVGSYLGAPHLTHSILPPGTYEFRSPEAYRFSRDMVGDDLYEFTRADDVWALGVTFYWLLTNALPFGDRYDPEGGGLAERIRHMEPVAPHVLNPRVPLALSALCLRMLEKKVEDRYTRVEEVCEALRQVLAEAGGEPGWDVPLCEPDAPGDSSSEESARVDTDGPLSWALGWLEHEPRRGVPPAEEGSALAEVANGQPDMPVAAQRALSEEESITRPTEPPLKVRRWWSLAVITGTTLVLALALGAGVWSLLFPPWADTPGTDRPDAPRALAGLCPTVDGGSGREMALASEALNPAAGEGALPYLPSLPASEFATAMLRKEDSRVKNQEKPAPRREVRRCVPIAKEVCKGALCTIVLVGCTSTTPQVRPTPQPADCPRHAEATMERELGIVIGHGTTFAFPEFFDAEPVVITVKEGPTQVQLRAPLGKLPPGTLLTGELLFGGKRVYGRFTQALTPEGKPFPVCIEFYSSMHPGVVVMPDSGRDTVRISSHSTVMSTNRFSVKQDN